MNTITLFPHPELLTEQSESRGYLPLAVKRSFDVLVSVLGLLFLSPVFLLIAYLIKRESPGPVFYRGQRLGCKGKTFGILKFRTMYERPESYMGPRVTGERDPRITPLGHWLRDTKINELPQLWNVLVGKMSLVGPRPEDPQIAATWPADARAEILSVRPGITSPASILYHDEEKLLTSANVMKDYLGNILPDKLRLDRLYVRNHSFFSDLDLIFWTAMVLLPRLRDRRIPEGYLLAGPIFRLMSRHVSWFLLDLLVTFCAAALSGYLWRLMGPLNWGLLHLAALAFLIAMLFSGVTALLGLNRVIWATASAEDALVLVFSNGLVSLALLAVNHLQRVFNWLPYPALPQEMIVGIGTLTLVGTLILRYRLRVITAVANRWLTLRKSESAFGERVLILGAGEAGQLAGWLLRRSAVRNAFNIVGMVDDDTRKQGMQIDGLRVLGTSGDLHEIVKRYNVWSILFAIVNISAEERQSLIDLCTIPGVRLMFINEIMDGLQSQLGIAVEMPASFSFAQGDD